VPEPSDWLAIARTADDADLREEILTGYKAGKPFTPYVPTMALPPDLGSVLDFGCGLGRNFPFLRAMARRVTGFDLPPMIARCGALADAKGIELADDWSTLRTRRFDLVFASLVLQHIDPAICRAYLEDFARMAPALYVLTRAQSDFDANLLALVLDSGWFPAGDCVEVEHDPATHQLRVLGRQPLGRARTAAAGHFEVLLRT
jgi:SAM-dependent methyltransferase